MCVGLTINSILGQFNKSLIGLHGPLNSLWDAFKSLIGLYDPVRLLNNFCMPKMQENYVKCCLECYLSIMQLMIMKLATFLSETRALSHYYPRVNRSDAQIDKFHDEGCLNEDRHF